MLNMINSRPRYILSLGLVLAMSYVIMVLKKQHMVINSYFNPNGVSYPDNDSLKNSLSTEVNKNDTKRLSIAQRPERQATKTTTTTTNDENNKQARQNETLSHEKNDTRKQSSRRHPLVNTDYPCGTCQFANNNLHESLCKKQQQQSSSSNNTKSSQSTRSIHPSCATLTPPLSYQTITPRHCRPTLILLSSFPTNGNGLVKETFSLLTNLITFSVYGKTEKGTPVMTLPFFTTPILRAEVGTWSFPLSTYCFSNNIIPTGGRPALAKTHLGARSDRIPKHPQALNMLDRHLDGVVRLARNPGDQLLRNSVRWNTIDRSNNNATHFDIVAEEYCDRALSASSVWNDFHELWETMRKGGTAGHLVMRYEEFADGGRAGRAYETLLSFVGETSRDNVSRVVRSVMRPPGYVQGGLFVEYCGVDMARRLHNETREMSRRLGYGFDEERGVWYLEELELDSIYRPMRHQVT